MTSSPYRCSHKEELRELCLSSGACACGFARAEALPREAIDRYDRWIASGHHASMDYMERYGELRADPRLLLEGARTIISLAFAYSTPGLPRSPLFADYALGDDYHEVLRSRLTAVAEKLEELSPGTRICVDTAPLRERFWATRAGIGFIGLNNHLIIPGIGSKVFLAEILWTGEVEPDESLERASCEGCGACVKACPHGALDGTGALDAARCLSFLTIENRGELPVTLPARIYGCDICQDVCPHNRDTRPLSILKEFEPRPTLLSLDAAQIAAMSHEQFSTTFRRSAIKRAKLAGLRRNALAALAAHSGKE